MPKKAKLLHPFADFRDFRGINDKKLPRGISPRQYYAYLNSNLI